MLVQETAIFAFGKTLGGGIISVPFSKVCYRDEFENIPATVSLASTKNCKSIEKYCLYL